MFYNKGCQTLLILHVHFLPSQDFISSVRTFSFLDDLIFAGSEFQTKEVLKRTELMLYIM